MVSLNGIPWQELIILGSEDWTLAVSTSLISSRGSPQLRSLSTCGEVGGGGVVGGRGEVVGGLGGCRGGV